MRGKTKFLSRAVVLAAFAASGQGAHAQPLQDWSLPDPDSTSSAPAVQGPVDQQNPVIRPAEPEPTPAPTITAPPSPPRDAPSPAPAPRPTTSQAPAPAPAPARTPSAATTPVEQTATATERPTVEATPTAPPTTAPAAAPEQLGDETPQLEEPPATVSQQRDLSMWWWAIPAVVALLVLGLALLRRRATQASTEEEEAVARAARPAAPPTQSNTGAEPQREARSPPATAPAMAPATPPAVPRGDEIVRARGQMDFQPTTLRLSLVYATLQFHLQLTASTEFPAGKLLADMISAHGSLPQDMQLRPPPEALQTIESFPRLAPGQVLDIKGQLQLPLNAIRPVQQGGGQFMVPLIRLALLGDDEPGLPHLELGCVFTVGLPGSGPALAPLRLDTGPRDVTGLSAREIESARRTTLLGLDHARAAG
ncbi:hypothetical protein [Novosphingobium malaysiense]|uniref:Uncharacterized protein n=1 Tax=Novosphingobium malaysiense TaxID=1348853 RepID=A0A0B1ZUX9_9SPHN|nr:hypothetical protein [Novosphingobium malaysiense]KHK93249.1 hypothetical protein LK12_02750 [Novosphingobium malaysiense]